ncbi:flagellar assembly factor FliW [Campylobacterota bacterium]|nr:flagellar assembly factor FliW [Campylobacterota bacterium]GHV02928.1 flagellar assembly factor FliW [Campylobacterota bacterium]
MIFDLVKPILGFEAVKHVEFNESDDLFATLADTEKSGLVWTLVNPYHLREYSFDITPDVQTLLGITEKSSVLVYAILALGKATDDSVINFLAPVVFNKDNGKAAQIVLDSKQHPDFQVAHKLTDFLTDK